MTEQEPMEEVIKLLRQGYAQKTIARKLHVTVRFVSFMNKAAGGIRPKGFNRTKLNHARRTKSFISLFKKFLA